MKKLKYLTLEFSEIEAIPSGFIFYDNLIALKVRNTSKKLIPLPQEFKALIKLELLEFPLDTEQGIQTLLELKNLKKLILPRLIPINGGYDHLKELSFLKELKVENLTKEQEISIKKILPEIVLTTF